FTRRRHLGLSKRGVSQQRSFQGTKLGQLHSLDYECAHLRYIPARGSLLRRISIYLLFSDDDRAVLCGAVRVSGNQRHYVGGDAEKADAKPGPLKLKAAMKSPLSLIALLVAAFLFSHLAFASDSQSPTPKAKTRLAIVGLDHDHVWELLKYIVAEPEAELVAIADPHPNLVNEAKSQVPKTVRFYSDYVNMLDEAKPEAVFVTTANDRHLEILQWRRTLPPVWLRRRSEEHTSELQSR